MNAVRPETARAIARITSQPTYDCEQVACDLTIKARNMAVRFRLETLLAEKASAGGVEVAPSAKRAGGIASRRAEQRRLVHRFLRRPQRVDEHLWQTCGGYALPGFPNRLTIKPWCAELWVG
jgi:hypothetical protein